MSVTAGWGGATGIWWVKANMGVLLRAYHVQDSAHQEVAGPRLSIELRQNPGPEDGWGRGSQSKAQSIQLKKSEKGSRRRGL